MNLKSCFFYDRLFEGSSITVGEANMMILSYSRRFQLAEVANEALVKLLRILLPQKNNLKKKDESPL